MVQEQEEEKEAEQEQEKEQEIEIEKFVDVAYSRDEESSNSWKVHTLSDPLHAVQFYRLADFHLYKRRPIEFPHSLMLSRNYFNPKWSGHRRMKNVVITMEWIAQDSELKELAAPSADYGSVSAELAVELLARTLETITSHRGGILSVDLLRDLLSVALHTPPQDNDEWSTVLAELQRDMFSSEGNNKATGAAFSALKAAHVFFNLLASNKLRREESGRNTVVLSLSEAETIRRIIHVRTVAGKGFLDSSSTAVALHLVPSGNALLDASVGFRSPMTVSQRLQNFQCLRFFDSDLHYSDQEFGFLLRSLHSNREKHRQAYFQQVIACRRRARQRWEKAPIAMLFLLKNAFTLLHQRVIGLCMYRELQLKELNLGDAFMCFNSSHSGVLSPGELWGAASFCRLSMSAGEVLDFLDVADSHHEGTVQYPDFLCVLTGSRELEETEAAAGGGGAADDKGKNLPTVPPIGEEELHLARIERIKKHQAEEAEASKEMESENQRVMDEIEAEQIREEIELLQNAGNPVLHKTALTFVLNDENAPKLLGASAGKVCRAADDEASSTVTMLTSNSSLKASLRCVKHLLGASVMKQYSITTEFKLPKPLVGDTKSGLLTRMSAALQTLDLLVWPLPLFMMQSVVFDDPAPFVEERLEKDKAGKDEQKKAEKSAKAQTKSAEAAAKSKVDDDSKADKAPEESTACQAPQTDESDPQGEEASPAPADDSNVADGTAEPTMAENETPPAEEAEAEAADAEEAEADAADEGGNDDDKADEDVDEEAPEGEEEDENNRRYPIFSSAAADGDIIGYLEENALVELGSHRVRTNIDGITYEWREVLDAHRPRGWVVSAGGQSAECFIQQSVFLRLNASRLELIVGNSNSDSELLTGIILPPGSIDHGSLDEAAEDSDDEGNINDLELFGDVGDLLEALRKAKSLKPGDRVTRNPESWDKGNEDGGEGKVGKVLKVEEANVTVQWPSGNKGTYIYGSAGKYDLIKVGEADEDEEEGELREVMNDDRWVSLLKNKGREKCNQCQVAKLELGDWFRCNQCEAFNLCRKCFKGQNHAEHDFTDMKAISVGDATELGLGSWVKIKIAVEEPAKGWQGATHDSVGIVTDIDRDIGTILVDFEGVGEWEGMIVEVEVTAAPKETDGAGGATVGVRKTPALDFIVSNRWKQSISILTEVAKRPTKFIVGDKVRAFRADYGACYPATVRAVLPAKLYTVVFDNEETSLDILEDQIKLLTLALGDKVRFKKSVTDPMYGWSYLQNLGEERYRREGKISYLGGGGSDYLYLNVNFDDNLGWTIGASDNDVEVVGGGLDKNVKWFMVQPRADPTNPAEEEQLLQIPSSSAIGIERAFQLGVKKAKFYVKEKNYLLDFTTMKISEVSAASAAQESTAAASSLWVAEREPPRPWEHHRQATNLEDGHWHILSLVVTEKDVLAYCDGETIELSLTGTVADKIAKIRARDAAALNHGQALPVIPGAAAAAPAAPPTQAELEDEAALAKLQISDFYSLPTQTPLFVLRTDATCEKYRAQTSLAVEESFPRRTISNFTVDWSGNPSTSAVVSSHKELLAKTSWLCKHCGASNYRFYDECDECQEPRMEKKAAKTQQQGKVRVVFPKSREAHQLRQKLQGKLRSQFQKELDSFDRSGAGAMGVAAEPRMFRDASPDVL